MSAMLAIRREQRAKAKATLLEGERLPPPPGGRTDAEWASLAPIARRVATQRERHYLHGFFKSHTWRTSDIAAAMSELGLVDALFDSPQFFAEYYARVGKLLKQ
eukprot:4075947-Prymnesium_polylepis.1